MTELKGWTYLFYPFKHYSAVFIVNLHIKHENTWGLEISDRRKGNGPIAQRKPGLGAREIVQ